MTVSSTSSAPEPPVVDHGSYFTNEVNKPKQDKFANPYATSPQYAIAFNEANVAYNSQNVSVGVAMKTSKEAAEISVEKKQAWVSNAGCTYFAIDEHQEHIEVGSHVFKRDEDTAVISLTKSKLDEKPQKVVAWIQGIDFERIFKETEYEVHVRVEQTAPYQFNLKLDKKACSVNEATIGWCAYDENSGFTHGEVSNLTADDETSQFDKLKWPSGLGLEKIPTILLNGWTGFKASKSKGDIRFMMRFKVGKTSLDGAEYEFGSDDHSVVKAGFGVYLAMRTDMKPKPPPKKKEFANAECETRTFAGTYDGQVTYFKIATDEKIAEERILVTSTHWKTSLGYIVLRPELVSSSEPHTVGHKGNQKWGYDWLYVPEKFSNFVPMRITHLMTDSEMIIHAKGWGDVNGDSNTQNWLKGFKPYQTVPKYICWLCSPDAVHSSFPCKATVKTSNATKDGLDIQVGWWSTTDEPRSNAFVTVNCFSWIPSSENTKGDFITGEFEVTQDKQSGTIDFSSYKLASAPKILVVGPTEVSYDHGAKNYDVRITDVTASGAKWKNKVEIGPFDDDDIAKSLKLLKIVWLAQRTD